MQKLSLLLLLVACSTTDPTQIRLDTTSLKRHLDAGVDITGGSARVTCPDARHFDLTLAAPGEDDVLVFPPVEPCGTSDIALRLFAGDAQLLALAGNAQATLVPGNINITLPVVRMGTAALSLAEGSVGECTVTVGDTTVTGVSAASPVDVELRIGTYAATCAIDTAIYMQTFDVTIGTRVSVTLATMTDPPPPPPPPPARELRAHLFAPGFVTGPDGSESQGNTVVVDASGSIDTDGYRASLLQWQITYADDGAPVPSALLRCADDEPVCRISTGNFLPNAIFEPFDVTLTVSSRDATVAPVTITKHIDVVTSGFDEQISLGSRDFGPLPRAGGHLVLHATGAALPGGNSIIATTPPWTAGPTDLPSANPSRCEVVHNCDNNALVTSTADLNGVTCFNGATLATTPAIVLSVFGMDCFDFRLDDLATRDVDVDFDLSGSFLFVSTDTMLSVRTGGSLWISGSPSVWVSAQDAGRTLSTPVDGQVVRAVVHFEAGDGRHIDVAAGAIDVLGDTSVDMSTLGVLLGTDATAPAAVARNVIAFNGANVGGVNGGFLIAAGREIYMPAVRDIDVSGGDSATEANGDGGTISVIAEGDAGGDNLIALYVDSSDQGQLVSRGADPHSDGPLGADGGKITMRAGPATPSATTGRAWLVSEAMSWVGGGDSQGSNSSRIGGDGGDISFTVNGGNVCAAVIGGVQDARGGTSDISGFAGTRTSGNGGNISLTALNAGAAANQGAVIALNVRRDEGNAFIVSGGNFQNAESFRQGTMTGGLGGSVEVSATFGDANDATRGPRGTDVAFFHDVQAVGASYAGFSSSTTSGTHIISMGHAGDGFSVVAHGHTRVHTRLGGDITVDGGMVRLQSSITGGTETYTGGNGGRIRFNLGAASNAEAILDIDPEVALSARGGLVERDSGSNPSASLQAGGAGEVVFDLGSAGTREVHIGAGTFLRLDGGAATSTGTVGTLTGGAGGVFSVFSAVRDWMSSVNWACGPDGSGSLLGGAPNGAAGVCTPP